jgi:hypothetical protein
MALPTLFERVVQSLFGGAGTAPEPKAEQQLVDDMIETIVETVEPRVRRVGRYNQKLQGCTRSTIAHLRVLGRALLEPIALTRNAWAGDPRVNAFFATPDDVPACLGRSRELRAFFEDPAMSGVGDAFALLGMKKSERKILAPSLEGDILRHDVAQVAVSFSDHKIIAPSRSEAETRLEVGRRVINRLAQVALSRIVALDEKATELQQHKAYLGARLRLLNLSRDGVQGVFEDPAAIGEQIKVLERELKATVDDYIDTKGSIATIEAYIEQIKAVFGRPEEHVALTHTPLRVSRMGIKLEEASTESANDIVLAELSIGENFRAVIGMVRCPRAEMPPKEDLIAKAERYL